ncbi:aldo/keto reductase [Sorangium sp. So ce302]|uniref:aldo/keto reductase n=1 Tax=unclassified Sorangium TaxID=2621164 RepID=UPI003F5F68BD
MRLGRTSLQIPRLGVGTMNWGDPSRLSRLDLGQAAYGPIGGMDEQRAAVHESIASGAGLFDTAGMYGHGASERAVGELTRDTGAFIATKFPSRLRSSGAGHLGAELEGSLMRLDRRSVELYQVHSPFPWLSIPRVMTRMADAVRAQKIGAVGVCNFSAAQMRLAHRALSDQGIPLASNQVEYSLLHRKPETDGVLEACRELGITLIAYMPLAMGALTGKYADGRRPAGFRRFMKVFRAKHEPRVSRTIGLLREIAEARDRSPGQVALRWLIQKDVVPIPGAKSSAQARHNAGALSFALSSSEIEALERETAAWRE